MAKKSLFGNIILEKAKQVKQGSFPRPTSETTMYENDYPTVDNPRMDFVPTDEDKQRAMDDVYGRVRRKLEAEHEAMYQDRLERAARGEDINAEPAPITEPKEVYPATEEEAIRFKQLQNLVRKSR